MSPQAGGQCADPFITQAFLRVTVRHDVSRTQHMESSLNASRHTHTKKHRQTPHSGGQKAGIEDLLARQKLSHPVSTLDPVPRLRTLWLRNLGNLQF